MPRTADPALEVLWRRRLRQQTASELSVAQFCRREGVSTASFHAWKRRLAPSSARQPTSGALNPTFLPITVNSKPEPQASPPDTHVAIRLANGGRILVPVTAGTDFVCQVIETVARVARNGEVLE